MTAKLINLRRRLHEKLRLAGASQDIADLVKEIEQETDKLLATPSATR
jgi:hypothetical protein